MSTMPHWHGRLGTIQQPLGSEPSAPPVVLLPYVVCVAGFDPAVSCFQGRRISRLSHTQMQVERTGGFEPPFSTPITCHRFVAGVGYVRVLARRRGFQPRSSSLRGKCPGALDDRRANWLPDQDSNLD